MLTITHDLYPTVMEFVEGAEPGTDIEGQSLVPVLTGAGSLQDRILTWYYPHYSPQDGKPCAAIRDGHYKLIHFYDPVKTELYNLTDDPGEENDLAEELPAIRDELFQKLNRWLERTGTMMPIIRGRTSSVYEK